MKKNLVLLLSFVLFLSCSSTSNIRKDSRIDYYKNGIGLSVYEKTDNSAEIKIYLSESDREYFILFDNPELFDNYEEAKKIFFELTISKYKVLSFIDYWYWYPRKYSNCNDFYYWRKY